MDLTRLAIARWAEAFLGLKVLEVTEPKTTDCPRLVVASLGQRVKNRMDLEQIFRSMEPVAQGKAHEKRHFVLNLFAFLRDPLPFIALQLGHWSPVVRAAHYAWWLARGYRAPLVPESGEAAADFLSRHPPSALCPSKLPRFEL